MQHLRILLRHLLKSPGFSAAAILTLALGIGANTAIFSVVHAILIRPFPYPDSEQILFIAASQRDQPESSFPLALPDLEDFQQQSDAFDGLGGAIDAQFIVTGDFPTVRMKGAYVSPETLELLRVAPTTGRLFHADDDRPGASRVCVLSHRAWERFFALRPDIIGRTAMLDGKPHEIVGVMPAEYKFWDAWFYVPLAHGIPPELRSARGIRLGMWGIGRVKANLTATQAEQALDVIARQIEAAFPAESGKVTVKVRALAETVGGRIRPTLLLLFGAVGCVLLIACVNVTNLMLARGASRTRELAVRSALGASRFQLVRQLLLETLPIGILAAFTGVLFATGGLRLLLARIPSELIPAEANIGLSWPVLAFTLAVGLLTALLAGILPAWQGARSAVAEALKDGGRAGTGLSGTRIRNGLVVAEVALALTLLVGAGLLLRNLTQIARTDPGFQTERLLIASLQLPEEQYRDPARCLVFAQQLLERTSRFPQVRNIGIASAVPMSDGGFNLPLLIEGRPFQREDIRSIQYSAVTPGTLETLGIRLIRGRLFQSTDHAGGERVVILNAEAAKVFFGDEDPLGRLVTAGIPPEMAGDNPTGILKAIITPPWARVIGIVRNTRQYGLTIDPRPEAFFPLEQSLPVPPARNNLSLILRTSVDPLTLAGSVRQEIQALDPNLPLDQIRTMEAIIADSLRGQRFIVVLLGVFASLALILAAVGIYSVVSWLVSQRTREMGIRLALGAPPSSVIRLVVTQGLRPVLIGLALGMALAVTLSRILRHHWFQLDTTDPLTYAATGLALVAIAAFACWIPARRAARIDPLNALRAE
jgi:putative ABC transport system permease protein